MLSNKRIKEFVVSELCPNIVESEKKMRIADLSAFLNANEAEVRKHNNKYICMFDDCQVSFDEEPTAELLEKYMNEPDDLSRQVEAVEDLVREIIAKSEKTNPYNQVKTCHSKTKMVGGKVVVSFDYHEFPPCKNCKGRDYINCTTHWTCRKCACVRNKIHEGVAYREMRDRQVDMNGRSMEINPLYSESFNRQTDVLFWNGTKVTREMEKLRTTNQRMNGSRRDTQLFAARETIEDICDRLRLRDGVVRKAHTLFCKHRKSVNVLRSENAVIAACIFHSLPEEAKIFARKKKRPLSPWRDSKKRRLKIMDLKKPIALKKKRRYSLVSTLKRKKAI